MENKTKYFEVYRYTATTLNEEKVYKDGSPIPGTDELIEDNAFVRYVVYEWEDADFAPDQKVYEGDEGDALDQIIADHPAGEWQNHDW